MKALRMHTLGIILSLFAVGCSIFGYSKPTPELRTAVVRVTNDYLTAIGRGNESAADGIILWITYLENKGFTKDDFRKQFLSLAKKYSTGNTPLRSLQVVDVQFDGEVAVVELKKTSDPSLGTVEVSLEWVGAGWLVVNDSIFGPNELAASLLAK